VKHKRRRSDNAEVDDILRVPHFVADVPLEEGADEILDEEAVGGDLREEAVEEIL
jgi:hypothetical protein